MNIEPQIAPSFNGIPGYGLGLIGRVIEDLDVKPVAGIIKPT